MNIKDIENIAKQSGIEFNEDLKVFAKNMLLKYSYDIQLNLEVKEKEYGNLSRGQECVRKCIGELGKALKATELY